MFDITDKKLNDKSAKGCLLCNASAILYPIKKDKEGKRRKIHMENDFINLTEENVSDEHLCCIIRSRKPHPGISAKREWLSERLKEGHVFRKVTYSHHLCYD